MIVVMACSLSTTLIISNRVTGAVLRYYTQDGVFYASSVVHGTFARFG